MGPFFDDLVGLETEPTPGPHLHRFQDATTTDSQAVSGAVSAQRTFPTCRMLGPAEAIRELNEAQMGMSSVGTEADHPGDRHSTVGHLVLAVNGIRLESPRNPKHALRDKGCVPTPV